MNEKIKELAEQYAAEAASEQKELLKTLGVIPAPSHQEDMRAAFCRDWFLEQGGAGGLRSAYGYRVSGYYRAAS